MTNEIKQKTVFALKWVTLLQASTTIGQFLIRFILANILFPDEIGLIAIVTVVTELMVTAADMGFNAAIIQRKKLKNSHLSTAFFLNIGSAIVLMFLVIVFSYPLSVFFNDVRLSELFKIVSFIILIRASVSVQIGLLDRKLRFKKIVILSLVALIFSSIAKIILAKNGYGAKSIAYGDILNQLIIAGYLWITSSWIPSIKKVTKQAFRELFSFGGNIMLVNTINMLSSKLDTMLIGRIAGTFATGLFSIAALVSDTLVSIINNIVQRVLFPSFSRIQDDKSKMRTGYLQATKYISLLGIPICIGIFFLADEIVNLFLQEAYKPAIILIKILSFRAVFNSMGGILWGQVLKATGKSRLVLILTIVKLFALVVFVYAGSFFGLEGIAAATVFYGAVFRFVYQHFINRIIEIKMFEYIKSLFPALASTFLMAISIFLIQLLLKQSGINNYPYVVITLFIGGLTYLSSFYLLFKKDFTELLKMLRNR